MSDSTNNNTGNGYRHGGRHSGGRHSGRRGPQGGPGRPGHGEYGDHRNRGPYHHHSRHRGYGYAGRAPWPLKLLMATVFIPGLLLLCALGAMLLWNALLPDLFGFPVLGFWQMAGILVLARLLFGGHPGGGRRGGGLFPRKPPFRDREEWRRHLREKFDEAEPVRSGESDSDTDNA